MSSNNIINYQYFKTKKEKQEKETNVIFSLMSDDQICFMKNEKSLYYEYSGFKLIKCLNTNRVIKNLLFKDDIYSNIKINDLFIKQKDIIIISPFTRINDILSAKNNGNLHTWLKQKQLISINNEIENFIVSKLKIYDENISNVTEYNFSKCDLINYLDIKEDFIDETNIKEVLDIIKTYDKKYLVIFNDVNYLSYESFIEYFQFFNFLCFVNTFDEEYKLIDNYEDYLVEYDNM